MYINLFTNILIKNFCKGMCYVYKIKRLKKFLVMVKVISLIEKRNDNKKR